MVQGGHLAREATTRASSDAVDAAFRNRGSNLANRLNAVQGGYNERERAVVALESGYASRYDAGIQKPTGIERERQQALAGIREGVRKEKLATHAGLSGDALRFGAQAADTMSSLAGHAGRFAGEKHARGCERKSPSC